MGSDDWYWTDIQGLYEGNIIVVISSDAGYFLPIFLFPGEVFHLFPISFTLEGQYIIKNIVLLSAGIVIGATVRGGSLVPEVMETD